jgi:hypothetical protein
MSVTLDEFVRVMSGGRVVGQDLLNDDQKRIDKALGRMDAALKAISGYNLTSGETDYAIGQIKRRRTEAQASPSRDERHRQLGTVADEAESEAKQAERRNQNARAGLQQFQALSQRIGGAIAANRAAMVDTTKHLNAADQPEVRKALTARFNDLETNLANAKARLKDVADLASETEQLRRLLPHLGAGGRDEIDAFAFLSGRIGRSRADLVDRNPDKAQRDAGTEALDELLLRARHATAGRMLNQNGPQDAAVNIDDDVTKLTPAELLRAVDAATSGVETALKAPQGSEGKLMDLYTPKKFAEALVRLNGTKIAYGTAYPQISTAEQFAIYAYTGDSYDPINVALLKGRDVSHLPANEAAKIKLVIELCEVALEKLPAYPKTAWPTLRNEYAWDDQMIQGRYGKGKRFVTQVFWSTGAARVADVPRQQSPRFLHTVFGLSGKDVAGMSANPGEGGAKKDQKQRKGMGKGEVLFPPTAKFAVQEHKVGFNPTNAPIVFTPSSMPTIRIDTVVKEYK